MFILQVNIETNNHHTYVQFKGSSYCTFVRGIAAMFTFSSGLHNLELTEFLCCVTFFDLYTSGCVSAGRS